MPFPLMLFGIWGKLLGFFPAALEFVMKYWKQCIVLGMAFIIFHQNFMEWQMLRWFGVQTIPAIEKQLILKQEEINQCNIDKELLTSKIATVNNQINKWANVSGQLQTQHDNLVNELQKMKKQSEENVQSVLDGPTPKNCEDAIRYLRDASTDGELKWKK